MYATLKFDTLTKEEWKDIACGLNPALTDEAFERNWAEYERLRNKERGRSEMTNTPGETKIPTAKECTHDYPAYKEGKPCPNCGQRQEPEEWKNDSTRGKKMS